jgi:transcriptional regulator with XRE-family HTH domain
MKGFRKVKIVRAITPAQIRAARCFAGWTQAQLASAAGVCTLTVSLLESQQRRPKSTTVKKIRIALEAAGVAFIAAGVIDPASFSQAEKVTK